MINEAQSNYYMEFQRQAWEGEKMDAWVGIDPGATGALAVIYKEGYEEVYDYDGTPNGLYEIVGDAGGARNCMVLLEKQQAFPGQGVTSMFKLGENYGRWQGMLSALGIRYEFITPVQWRNQIFDSMPKQKDKKAMSLDMARRIFPKMASQLARKKDHGRAEALLLAALCRRKYGDG
jgi:hypothetical protein